MLVKRQSRLFRDGNAAAGRALDTAIREARSARDGAIIELSKHVDSHDRPVTSA